ncbi:SRPBCC family protein [Bacteroidota bacterium]
MRYLKTEIIIDAPAERIWSILTDFEKFPEWNPFIKSVQGEVKEGEKFTVTLQ